MDNDFITPTFGEDDLYKGKEYELTVPGVYKMAVENISLRKTSKGLRCLSIFFVHADPENKTRFKGVNGMAMLEGEDKNGKPLARQFGDFITALGYDNVAGKVAYAALDDLDTADWKGVPVAVAINGEVVDLKGKECIVKVVADLYQGKTRMKANGFYRIS